MGAAASCCGGVPEPEFNPDGGPKDTQNGMQVCRALVVKAAWIHVIKKPALVTLFGAAMP